MSHKVLVALGKVCCHPGCMKPPAAYSQSCSGHLAAGRNAIVARYIAKAAAK